MIPAMPAAVRARRPCLWLNPGYVPDADAQDERLDPDVAAARFTRCAGLLAMLFPELAAAGGELRSPLLPIPRFRTAMGAPSGGGAWLLKRDDALPVAGSVKARGGFHEVLALAEDLAGEAGLPGSGDDRAALASPRARALFGRHTIAVGSTGNLGLAIGLIGARLGFHVVVHMSADAKAWKKERLRARGIEVVGHPGDYASAVAAGRELARRDPAVHFVDDERSEELFLGYATAAGELAMQLQALHRAVDADHPLFVYLPCGVGGAPGGILYGLKRRFGPHVHGFFAEPVAAPCMLVQVAAGTGRRVSVYDVGLDNRTEADGLAVGLASPLVSPLMAELLSGVLTVDDDSLLRDAWRLEASAGVYVEPSAAAGFGGPLRLLTTAAGHAYLRHHHLEDAMARSTHVLWSTGGALVPEPVRASLRARGRALAEHAGDEGDQAAD